MRGKEERYRELKWERADSAVLWGSCYENIYIRPKILIFLLFVISKKLMKSEDWLRIIV